MFAAVAANSRNESQMNVTLSDVARAAGISTSTASRALSSPQKVNTETARKIQQIAKRMGYVSNRQPRAKVKGPTGMLGLIVPDIANPFFPPIIKAVQARADMHGRGVVIADIDEYPADEARHARFLAKRVDGLIIASARSTEEKLVAVGRQLPLVLINRECKDVSSVAIETAAGVYEAVEHLAALGHRSISYLNGPRRSWSNAERQNAVREATKDAGLELIEFGPFEPQIQAGTRAADLVYASGATAVIAFDDLIALGVMARLNERGVRVGDDMSLIGIDDTLLSGLSYPSLTTVHVPGERAGAEAVDMLVDLIDDRLQGREGLPLQRSVQVETQLVVRGSTAIAPPDR